VATADDALPQLSIQGPVKLLNVAAACIISRGEQTLQLNPADYRNNDAVLLWDSLYGNDQ
jgi:hypothetical protein